MVQAQVNGTWEIGTEVFTMRYTPYTNELQFSWSLSGTTLILSGADSEFDFDDDVDDDPAKLNLVLVKH